MAEYCPRCGNRDVVDPRFCYMCSDGVADAARAAEVVAAAEAGVPHAARILDDLTDQRAFDVIVEAASTASPEVRRRALTALGGIGDARGRPAAIANLEDADDRVRHAAIGALAELGPDGADAIASRLGVPDDRRDAARALAWLHDERAFEPLAMIVDSDELINETIFEGATIGAIGRLGGPRAIEVLAAAGDRVVAAADADAPDWQVRQAASTIGQALVDMRDPAADAAYERLQARFGRLYVIPVDLPESYLAPRHPRRTVPRWSFDLEPATEPITAAVGKVGGQPVWVDTPTWPLGTDGAPATFMAQFEIPGRPGLVYLFLDPSDETYVNPGIVFGQPGGGPDRFDSRATGPAFWTEISRPTRYPSRMLLRMVESRIVLEEGLDLDDWDVLNADPETTRDDDRDWNKIGGNPRWLQGDEMPDEPGWRIAFQFTATRMGREMADGAECYGLINDDGRGRFIIQSH